MLSRAAKRPRFVLSAGSGALVPYRRIRVPHMEGFANRPSVDTRATTATCWSRTHSRCVKTVLRTSPAGQSARERTFGRVRGWLAPLTNIRSLALNE